MKMIRNIVVVATLAFAFASCCSSKEASATDTAVETTADAVESSVE